MLTDWTAFEACLGSAAGGPHPVLKIVVSDEADYTYARKVAARIPTLPVYLQVGNHTPAEPNPAGQTGVDHEGLLQRFRWLVGRVGKDRWFEVTVLPQLHVLGWGNRRGV
jgi:7-carboxy-7-deazaguanine synthase